MKFPTVDPPAPEPSGGERAFAHSFRRFHRLVILFSLLLLTAPGAPPLAAQTLFNIDFGVGAASGKTGFAATGMSTNDYWNLYNLYGPRFIPGTRLQPNGRLDKVRLWDNTESPVSVAVTNAPGVWGNASGDKMFDSYLFAMNGSNLTVTVTGLLPGRYHFYLYGHADPDVTGEQNSLFTLHSGTNTFGPLTTTGATGWKAALPWEELRQYVVFRNVPVQGNQPVTLNVAPGPNGVAVINGLQIVSRGTAPPRLAVPPTDQTPSAYTNLIFREVRYDGKVSDTEARFNVSLNVESLTTNVISAPLFDGDVAVIAPTLPDGLRLVSGPRQFHLFAAKPGKYILKLDVVARITRAEPWNQISFTGPAAAISAFNAQAA
ncbi:MAG: hypothetical protein HYZ36_01110, partial [Pedosphaera parvula]|nr:hypothetical protein [Pedosphaera parvula]